jgi:transposase
MRYSYKKREKEKSKMVRKRPQLEVKVKGPWDFEVRNLGPLVLAYPMLRDMKIKDFVDKHCPPDVRLEVPIGDIILALAANRLCSPQPLMHVAEWAHTSGAELQLGIPADALNDDRLGRALDAVFEKRWNILADVALHVSSRFSVDLYKVHYDTTSFHFTGEYDNQSSDPALVPEIAPFKIEKGRHSELKKGIKVARVGVNLANDGKGPVPFFYHTADGSANDHISTAKNLQHLLKFVKPKRLLQIGDRGNFSVGQAIKLSEKRFYFIYSLPWSEELAHLYSSRKPSMVEASFRSLAEKRKRKAKKPEEEWERYFIGEIPHTIKHKKQHLGVRLVYVYSTRDEKTCRSTREKHVERIRKGLEKVKRGVESGREKDITNVHKRVARAYGQKKAQKYFEYTVAALTAQEIRSLPTPRKGCVRPALKFSYTYYPERAQEAAQYDGVYALMTNLPRAKNATDEVFTAFKEQHHIETSHHQWKAPIRLRPLFLKKVRRLESLVFVQFLALMAFYLLQRRYRNAKGKDCRTTGETLLRRFAHCPIAFKSQKNSVEVIAGHLMPRQAETLRILELPSVEQQLQSYVTTALYESDLGSQDNLPDR